MSDNFIQAVTRGANADVTTSVVTINGVVAGNTLVAFLFDGSTNNPTTHTVADGQGSYTSRASTSDATNNVFAEVFTLVNANAGSHTVTGTVDASGSCWIGVVEVGTSSAASAFSGANAAFQSNPGAGANILNSGNATVTAASTLIGISSDTSSTATSDEPTAGTSPVTFTSRDNNASTVMGAYRVETGAAASAAAATAGPVTTTHNFVTLVAAILNGAGTSAPPSPSVPSRRMISWTRKAA